MWYAQPGKRLTSVKIITESLRSAKEDALVGQFPKILPVGPLAAACQLLNGGLQWQLVSNCELLADYIVRHWTVHCSMKCSLIH